MGSLCRFGVIFLLAAGCNEHETPPSPPPLPPRPPADAAVSPPPRPMTRQEAIEEARRGGLGVLPGALNTLGSGSDGTRPFDEPSLRGGMRARTPNSPSISLGVPVVQGQLDPSIIRRYLKRNRMKLEDCYEKRLAVKPQLAGTILAHFVISIDGTVPSSNATGLDAETASCLASVVRTIEFPQPLGGNVQVDEAFTLRPSDP